MPESPEPPPPPPAGDPPALPSAHGSLLVAPLRAGPDGERTAVCPVCLAAVAVPAGGSGWANVRCDSCGCDFIASDGSLPPPPPPPPPPPLPPIPAVKFAAAGSRLVSLILLGDGGRRLARCPSCHSLEPVGPAGGRVEVRCGSCGTEFIASTTLAPPPAARPTPAPASGEPAAAPAPPPAPPAVVAGAAVRTAPDGSRSVVCPLCSRFSVALPRVLPTFTIRVTCPGCRAAFTVDLRRARPRAPLAPAVERVRPPARQTPKWAVFALITLTAGIAGYLLWHVVAAALWVSNFEG